MLGCHLSSPRIQFELHGNRLQASAGVRIVGITGKSNQESLRLEVSGFRTWMWRGSGIEVISLKGTQIRLSCCHALLDKVRHYARLVDVDGADVTKFRFLANVYPGASGSGAYKIFIGRWHRYICSCMYAIHTGIHACMHAHIHMHMSRC